LNVRAASGFFVACALLLPHESLAQRVQGLEDLDPQTRRLLSTPPEMSWNIDPATQTYVNQQTKVAFRRAIAGFRLQNAVPAALDGTATFTYGSQHGSVTVLLVPRTVVGCARGQDCTSPAVAAQSGQMKRMHGKTDAPQTFRLEGAGRRRGQGASFRAAASPQFGGNPAFCEVGAVEIGDFVYAYRAAFKDAAGLAELREFLRSFGLRRT
jgi:hypothetical protein